LTLIRCEFATIVILKSDVLIINFADKGDRHSFLNTFQDALQLLFSKREETFLFLLVVFVIEGTTSEHSIDVEFCSFTRSGITFLMLGHKRLI
jgi:hypothetical protein